MAWLTAAEVFENPRRAAVLEAVRDDPGVGFLEVIRRTGLAKGTVRHHLNVLERSGLVREFRFGVGLVLMPAEDRRNPVAVAALREPGMMELHELVRRLGTPSQGEVVAALEGRWPSSTVEHRLSRLVRARLLRVRLAGRYKHYLVSDGLNGADVEGDLDRLRAAARQGPAAFYAVVDSIAKATTAVVA